MQQMRNATYTVAQELLKPNNTVTDVEIKAKLINDYPDFYWSQERVTLFMNEYAKKGLFTYKDNSTYRTYSDPLISIIRKVIGAKPKKVAKKVTKKAKVAPVPKISRMTALKLIENNKGHFFTATFIKKDNSTRLINCRYLKDQTNSHLGYVKVIDEKLRKLNPNDCTRQINLQTLTDLNIAGKTYKVG